MTDHPPIPAAPRRGLIARIASGRGIWALGDQAVLSLGNFLTNWVLLRTLPADSYGNYYTVLSFVLFLNNLHMSLVTYPLSIAGATGDDDDLRRRTRRAAGLTLLLAFPFAAGVAYPTARVGGWSLVPWVVVALVLWQLQETLRRAMLARLQHHRAVLGDAVSYLGQAAIVWAIARRTSSAETVFAVVAITSAASIGVQAFQLDLFATAPPKSLAGHWTDGAREHWTLGQWLLLTNLVNVVTVYATPWAIRYFQGSGGAAMFSAVVQLLNAGNPVLASVAGLVTPAVAKAAAERDAVAARRVAAGYAAQGAALLVPFYALLLFAPHFVLVHMYKGTSPYVVLTTPMRLFVGVYAVTYVAAMVASYLCGLGQSRLPFYGQLANAAVSVIVTLPLAARYGVSGAAIGGLVAVTVQLVVNLSMLRQSRGTAHESVGTVVSVPAPDLVEEFVLQ